MARTRRADRRRGRAWEVIERHYTSRAAFGRVFRAYEGRVQRLVKERGISRDALRLGPEETGALFDTKSMEALLRDHVGPLREASHSFFRENNIAEPYDSEVSKIFHELSILKEEHLSVRDFPRKGSTREFSRLFREVSEYYPVRLRRVRDLFQRAQRRLDALLPDFREDRIVLRSAFLFRHDLWPDAPDQGLVRLLTKVFPHEGPVYGFQQLARSFFKAAFYADAVECARMGAAVAGKQAQARSSRAQHVREMIGELDRIVSRAQSQLKALQQ